MCPEPRHTQATIRRAKRPCVSPDSLPTAGEHTGNEDKMELLLYMSSQLQAMETYIAQWDDADCEQVEVSKEASMRSHRVAIHS